ncbi:MAG: hypothetical protein HY394_00345 [Candidatus Diapherotrites archaeon]|nr:hypothetical protein [Candidatus Diapherotrites archaeon]
MVSVQSNKNAPDGNAAQKRGGKKSVTGIFSGRLFQSREGMFRLYSEGFRARWLFGEKDNLARLKKNFPLFFPGKKMFKVIKKLFGKKTSLLTLFSKLGFFDAFLAKKSLKKAYLLCMRGQNDSPDWRAIGQRQGRRSGDYVYGNIRRQQRKETFS